MGHVVSIETPPEKLAYEDAVRRYASYALGVARGVLRDADLAEDACQEAFLALLRRREGFEAEGVLRVWLGRVARNAALKILRTRRRRRRREQAVRTGPTGEGGSMDEAAGDARHALETLVDALPDEQRLVVRLKYFERLPQVEMAAILDCSTGTISNRVHEALAALRRRASSSGAAVLLPGLESRLARVSPAPVSPSLIDRLLLLEGTVTTVAATGGVSVVAKVLLSSLVLVAAVVGVVVWRSSAPSPEATAAGGRGTLAREAASPDARPRLVGRAGAVPTETPAAQAPPVLPRAASGVARGIVLRGRVLTPGERPATGAVVVVQTPTKSATRVRRETQTAADGTWSVADLPAPERYVVDIRQEGFAPLRDRLGLLDPTNGTIVRVEHHLHAGWSIRGVLRDPAGDPVTGDVPALLRTGSSVRTSRLHVDAEGRFEIRDLDPRKQAPDELVLELRHPRFVPQEVGDWGDRIGRDGWASVQVRLERGASLGGVVSGLEGRPAPGVALVLLPEGAAPQVFTWDRRATRTDQEGRFLFEGLPEGRYVLRGSAVGLVVEHPLEIEVRGTQRIERDVAMGKGRTLTGRVVDARGRPLTLVRVALDDGPEALGLEEGEPVDREGRFRIEGLSLERRDFTLSLTNVPSFQQDDLETSVVSATPREMEILIRSRSAQAAPGSGGAHGTGTGEQGPASTQQVLIPTAAVGVEFPPGD